MEAEVNHKLADQLQSEISKAKQENAKLIEIEKKLNEQKLKVLIKFEKIKLLEDFYNVSTTPLLSIYLPLSLAIQS